MVLFFNACFLFAEEDMLGFDESDEEEMLDLLSAALACPPSSVGQPHVAEDYQ